VFAAYGASGDQGGLLRAHAMSIGGPRPKASSVRVVGAAGGL